MRVKEETPVSHFSHFLLPKQCLVPSDTLLAHFHPLYFPSTARPAEPALDQDLQEVQRLLDELHRNGTPAALERIKSAFAGMLDFSNEARKTFLHQSKSDREMSKENEKWKENPANKETLLGTKDFFNTMIKEHTAPAREAAKDFDQSDPKWKHTIDVRSTFLLPSTLIPR